ncbi:MAG: WYL domain-containing protein [Propionibacteriaceae bacterium]|jgi:proteasome accessory factor C|nr:WYL domain-containing protein [Propionibacteriaceae bacterium]
MTSQDQVERLLSLVPYLQQHPGVALDKAARVFDVTPEQIMKDLRVVLYTGLPGGLPGDLIEVDLEVVESDGEIYLSNSEFLPRPLRFSGEEALALIIALEAIIDVYAGEAADAAASALSKLVEAVGAAQLGQVWVDVASGDDTVRAALTAAIAANRRVQFHYLGVSTGEETAPIVDPVRIDIRDGVAYLIGFTPARAAWRTYRLERITAVVDTGIAAAAPPDAPPRKASWFEALDADFTVTLDLSAAAEWVSEYLPVRDKKTIPKGLRVSLPVASPQWLTRLLLSLGPYVLAVNPPEAAADAVAKAGIALRELDAFTRAND